MSKIHKGVRVEKMRSFYNLEPLCGRATSFATKTTDDDEVTCKWCRREMERNRKDMAAVVARDGGVQ